MALVGFIVPTVGRSSLKRAVDSIYAQTDPDYHIYVVGDGAAPLELEENSRLTCWSISKQGSAGLTRNFGKKGSSTDWVAFLDDDDVIGPTYVAHLREHIEDYPWAEIVVFRMKHPALGVLPPRDGQLKLGTVGISFALRRDIADEYDFVREERNRAYHEDWQLMEQLITDQRRIFLSPHTEYFVRETT